MRMNDKQNILLQHGNNQGTQNSSVDVQEENQN